jgi:hypothetical protein
MAGDVVLPPGARRSFRKSARNTTLETTSEQLLAVDGGTRGVGVAAGRAYRLGRGLDGGDELRGLGVDGDVPAEQHAAAADDLPGVPGASCGSAAMSALLVEVVVHGVRFGFECGGSDGTSGRGTGFPGGFRDCGPLYLQPSHPLDHVPSD